MLSDQQAQTVWFMTYELCDPRGETAALCSRQEAPKWEQRRCCYLPYIGRSNQRLSAESAYQNQLCS